MSKRSIGSDLGKVDRHAVQQAEYDELPELTDAMMDQADVHEGGRLVRRGRPPSQAPKRLVSIRLDVDVLDGLRATGEGWQTRVNEALRDWLGRQG